MARVYKRTDRDDEWWIDYSVGGRRIRKSLKTTDKKTAKLALADLELKLAKKELGLGIKRIKLHPYIEEYCQFLSIYKYKGTATRYLEIVRIFQKFAKDIVYLDAVTIEVMDEYVKWRMKQVKAVTVNADLNALNGMFKMAEEKGFIPRNPLPRVRRLPVEPKKIEYFSKQEIRAIMENARTEQPELYRAFLFMAHTGCRRGEVINLEWSDLDFDRRTIKIQNKGFWSTKTKKDRILPMHPRVYEELVAIEPKQGWVFKRGDGRRLDQHMREALVSIVRSLGITKSVNIHTFRHSFATHLLSEGSDIVTVQSLCGHQDIETTRKYLHLVEDNLPRAIARLDFNPDPEGHR